MRKNISFFILIAAIWSCIILSSSCSNKDEFPVITTNLFPDSTNEGLFRNLDVVGSYINNQENLYGTVCYNEKIQKWFVQVVIKGTIDNVECYYPLQITKILCKAGKKVVFSGKVYNLDEQIKKQIEQLGGYNYYAIELTEIKEDIQ